MAVSSSWIRSPHGSCRRLSRSTGNGITAKIGPQARSLVHLTLVEVEESPQEGKTSGVPRKTLTTLGPYSYGRPSGVSSVRSMPPATSRCSRIVMVASWRSRSIQAAQVPAKPAPTTTISIRVFLGPRRG